jgi:hypothetical protein
MLNENVAQGVKFENDFEKEIRTIIRDQTAAANNRINWMLGSLGLLFGSAFKSDQLPKCVSIAFAVFGVTLSIAFYMAIKINQRSIKHVLISWDNYIQVNGYDYKNFAPVITIDEKPSKLRIMFEPQNFIPWLSAGAWILDIVYQVIR